MKVVGRQGDEGSEWVGGGRASGLAMTTLKGYPHVWLEAHSVPLEHILSMLEATNIQSGVQQGPCPGLVGRRGGGGGGGGDTRSAGKTT